SQQQQLNLSDHDIEPIENEITQNVESLLNKINQYEQVIVSSIQYEYPLSTDTREELSRLQNILELPDNVAQGVRDRVFTRYHEEKREKQKREKENRIRTSNESETQRTQTVRETPVGKSAASRSKRSPNQKTGSQHIQEISQSSPPPGVQPQYRKDVVSNRSQDSGSKKQESIQASPPPGVQPQYRKDVVSNRSQDSESSSTTPENLYGAQSQSQASTCEESTPASSNEPHKITASNTALRLHWMILSVAGLGVGSLLGHFVVDALYGDSPGLLAQFTYSSVYGIVLGTVQWWYLHRLNQAIGKQWIWLTTVGFALGSCMAFVTLPDSSMNYFLYQGFYGIMEGGVAGAAQWFVLRNFVPKRRALSWIAWMALAHSVGFALVFDRLIYTIVMWTLWIWPQSVESFILSSTAGLIIGGLTSIPLVKMLKRPSYG
ncbi:MAG: hypothetical protein AAFV85_27185, partial [Cyanobacteria bacterium J06634_6]